MLPEGIVDGLQVCQSYANFSHWPHAGFLIHYFGKLISESESTFVKIITVLFVLRNSCSSISWKSKGVSTARGSWHFCFGEKVHEFIKVTILANWFCFLHLLSKDLTVFGGSWWPDVWECPERSGLGSRSLGRRRDGQGWIEIPVLFRKGGSGEGWKWNRIID